MIRSLLYILLLAFSLSSCRSSFLQRRYTPGFFAEKNHSAEAVSQTKKTCQETRQHLKNITASLEKRTEPHTTLKETIEKKSDSTVKVNKQNHCGDTLIFRNGQKVVCKVSVISESEIHYRHCSDTTVLRKVLVSDVKQIVFSNGLTETFVKPNSQPARKNLERPQQSKDSPKAKTNWLAVVGQVLIMFAGASLMFTAPLIGALLAGLAIFGIVVLVQDKNVFHRYLYSFYKITGIIAAIASFIALAFILIVLGILIATGI